MAPGQGMGSRPGRGRPVTDGRAATTLAVGGERRVPVPDAIARDYLVLVPAPGPARPGPRGRLLRAGRPQGEGRPRADPPVGAPRRGRRALLERIARRGRRAGPPALARRPARRDPDASAEPSPAIRCPTSTMSTRCFDSDGPPARRGGLRRPPPRELDRAAAGRRAAGGPAGGLGRPLRHPAGAARRRHRPARGAVPGACRRPCSACPPGEGLRVGLVTDQPWSGYNWYDGGLQSRVDINTDLPVRATRLVDSIGPRDVPGPSPRARLEGGRSRRRRAAGSRRAS